MPTYPIYLTGKALIVVEPTPGNRLAILDDGDTIQACLSTDRGETWTELDSENRIGPLGPLTDIWQAFRSLAVVHPTDPDIICVVYCQNVEKPPDPIWDVYLYVKEFNIITQTWGIQYGGLIEGDVIPSGSGKSTYSELAGVARQQTDGIVVVYTNGTFTSSGGGLYPETLHDTTGAYFRVISCGESSEWSAPIQAYPGRPNESFDGEGTFWWESSRVWVPWGESGYPPTQWITVDSSGRVYATLVPYSQKILADALYSEDVEPQSLYQSVLSLENSVSVAQVATAEEWDSRTEDESGALLYPYIDRSLGGGFISSGLREWVFLGSIYQADEASAAYNASAGYCEGGGTLDLNLPDLLASADTDAMLYPFQFYIDGKIWVWYYRGSEDDTVFVTFSTPNSGTPSAGPETSGGTLFENLSHWSDTLPVFYHFSDAYVMSHSWWYWESPAEVPAAGKGIGYLHTMGAGLGKAVTWSTGKGAARLS